MGKMKITKALLQPINTSAIILLGVYTVVWGFWLANPWWEVFKHAALYSELDAFANEYFWGGLAIICGAVTIYGAYRPSYRALVAGSSIAFIHWLVISTFYFWGDWENTGGITSLTFAIYAAFIYLNIKINHRKGYSNANDMFDGK